MEIPRNDETLAVSLVVVEPDILKLRAVVQAVDQGVEAEIPPDRPQVLARAVWDHQASSGGKSDSVGWYVLENDLIRVGDWGLEAHMDVASDLRGHGTSLRVFAAVDLAVNCKGPDAVRVANFPVRTESVDVALGGVGLLESDNCGELHLGHVRGLELRQTAVVDSPATYPLQNVARGDTSRYLGDDDDSSSRGEDRSGRRGTGKHHTAESGDLLSVLLISLVRGSGASKRGRRVVVKVRNSVRGFVKKSSLGGKGRIITTVAVLRVVGLLMSWTACRTATITGRRRQDGKARVEAFPDRETGSKRGDWTESHQILLLGGFDNRLRHYRFWLRFSRTNNG